MSERLQASTLTVHEQVKKILRDRDDRLLEAVRHPPGLDAQRAETSKREAERQSIHMSGDQQEQQHNLPLKHGMYELIGLVTHKGASADSGQSCV